MPIRPENKDKYPDNWTTEIRPRILARAENKCEICGVANEAIGWWDGDQFIETSQTYPANPVGKIIQIVLTIAHLKSRAHSELETARSLERQLARTDKTQMDL